MTPYTRVRGHRRKGKWVRPHTRRVKGRSYSVGVEADYGPATVGVEIELDDGKIQPKVTAEIRGPSVVLSRRRYQRRD